jgi:hypothetical protein
MRRRAASTPNGVTVHLAAEEARRRSITMTLNRLGVRYCACGCGKYCDDIYIRIDGVVTPMAHACAERARPCAEAVPA